MSNTSDNTSNGGPGDVEIVSLSLITLDGKTFDIIKLFRNIEIFEDLTQFFITGNIVIADALEIRSRMPLQGCEYIKIEFKTPNSKYSFSNDFYIYKMSPVVTEKTLLTYILYFVSYEKVFDLTTRLSKKYQGTGSTILNQIMEESKFNSYKIDSKKAIKPFAKNSETNKIFAFISNYWTPSECFEYIINNTYSTKGDLNFLFYENRNGFNFVTLDELKSSNTFITFYATENSPKLNDTINPYFKILGEIKDGNGFNMPLRLSTGYYGGTAISFDGLTQQYTFSPYTRTFESKSNKELNNYSPLSKSVEEKIVNTTILMHYIPREFNNFEVDGYNSNFKDTVKRKLLFSRFFNTNQIEIRVYGRTEYYVGMKVGLISSRKGQQTETDIASNDKDVFISGNYIVSSLCHRITCNMEHYCDMRLVKDSYIANLDSMSEPIE